MMLMMMMMMMMMVAVVAVAVVEMVMIKIFIMTIVTSRSNFAPYFGCLNNACALTILTLLTLEPWTTRTAISFVCKTGLTGCTVLARDTDTSALHSRKTIGEISKH